MNPLFLILGLVAAGAYLFLSKKPSTPASVSGLTPEQVKTAVATALQEETNPDKLDEFANSLLPDYPDYANQLHAKASLLRQHPAPPGGGTTPPPEPPPPQPIVYQGPTATTLWDIDAFTKAYPDAGTFLNDSLPPHEMPQGFQICLFYQTTAGGDSFIAVPADVAVPDPQAAIGHVTANVAAQVPGGPPPGTEVFLSTTDESAMTLDEGGAADPAGRFLAAHHPAPPPGVMT